MMMDGLSAFSFLSFSITISLALWMTSPMLLACRGFDQYVADDDVVWSQHGAVSSLTLFLASNICAWVQWTFFKSLLRSSIEVLL